LITTERVATFFQAKLAPKITAEKMKLSIADNLDKVGRPTRFESAQIARDIRLIPANAPGFGRLAHIEDLQIRNRKKRNRRRMDRNGRPERIKGGDAQWIGGCAVGTIKSKSFCQ